MNFPICIKFALSLSKLPIHYVIAGMFAFGRIVTYNLISINPGTHNTQIYYYTLSSQKIKNSAAVNLTKEEHYRLGSNLTWAGERFLRTLSTNLNLGNVIEPQVVIKLNYFTKFTVFPKFYYTASPWLSVFAKFVCTLMYRLIFM